MSRITDIHVQWLAGSGEFCRLGLLGFSELDYLVLVPLLLLSFPFLLKPGAQEWLPASKREHSYIHAALWLPFIRIS
jgi:hypothetical protein